MDTQQHLPFVTVVCTCFNHRNYVLEALTSVKNQTYPNIQVIVVDNHSTDGSVEVIQSFIHQHPDIVFLQNLENLGICKAFNLAAKQAQGKYLIDLSADDVLMPDRIAQQVTCFESLPNHVGLLYSHIEQIDQEGKTIKSNSKETLPSGDLFADVLERYFIPSPSTMFRTDVFWELGGYNEKLAFEDFDYWVRCARKYHFHFLNIVSTKKRATLGSLSSHFLDTKSSFMLDSTLATYEWAAQHLRNEREHQALYKGLSYFYRQAVFLGHFATADNFKKISKLDQHPLTQLATVLKLFRIKAATVYNLFLALKG
jgi:glycosyltransferase involved in cell wall biosynthesis